VGPLSSENALFLECLPHRDNFRIVNEQQRDHHAADLSPGLQLRPIPLKVFCPRIASGMEQANDFAAIRIKSGDVRAYKAVAMDAGEGEILKFGRAPTLPRYDVIHLERC
jgi:hypothetical protein